VGSVDRRVESEESGDEEGKKHGGGGIVANLSEQSLKDGVDRGAEDPEGTRFS
jgi:protein phosphatase 1 regulatory subunit 7